MGFIIRLQSHYCLRNGPNQSNRGGVAALVVRLVSQLCMQGYHTLSVMGFHLFAHWIFSPQTLRILSFAGNRASEGGDGKMGEDFMLGGHADGVRGPIVALLVQPLLRTELQEAPRAGRGSAGRHHRGGHHRDPTGVVHWPSVHVSKDRCDALALGTPRGFSERCKTLKTFPLTRRLENKTRPVSR